MSTVMVRVGASPDHGNERLAFDVRDEPRAQKNHSQTLGSLDARGGLSWCEAAAILEDREWRKMEMADAKARVIEIIARRAALNPQAQEPDNG
jgi:hypothetical protein